MAYENTNVVCTASVVITRCVKTWDPSFSYHATVWSVTDPASASTSPSPSTSTARTVRGFSAEPVMRREVKDWEPSFSYHSTLLSSAAATSGSRSPSPSTSAATAAWGLPTVVTTTPEENVTLLQKAVGRLRADGRRRDAGVALERAAGATRSRPDAPTERRNLSSSVTSN